MQRFRVYNGASPTTAKFAAVTTGTSIKTLLQLKPFNPMKVCAWGISFDGSSAATPIAVELIETGTVNATVTIHTDAGIVKMGMPTDQTAASVAGLTLATSGTGFTASAEGTITASRLFDGEQVAPTNQYIYQWPLGQEPYVPAANILRVRVHAGAAVNAVCWVEIEF
jgi:hypothetical protein